MIMKNLERRLRKLEEKLKISEENKYRYKYQELLGKLFNTYGVPTPQEFVSAMTYRDKLEYINSDWLKRLLANGGKDELLEAFDIGDKLEEERRKLM